MNQFRPEITDKTQSGLNIGMRKTRAFRCCNSDNFAQIQQIHFFDEVLPWRRGVVDHRIRRSWLLISPGCTYLRF
jgi:hypothetical protein